MSVREIDIRDYYQAVAVAVTYRNHVKELERKGELDKEKAARYLQHADNLIEDLYSCNPVKE